MASLSELLNEKIGKHGKSKASVADHLGISERTVENYMKGTREPELKDIVKLSLFLGFSMNDLYEQNVPRGTLHETKHNGHVPTVLVEDVHARYVRLLEENLKEKKEAEKGLQLRLDVIGQTQQEILSKLEMLLSVSPSPLNQPGGTPVQEVEVVYTDKNRTKDNKNKKR
jgi:transcriptional regulator with XRE-family HTH domain